MGKLDLCKNCAFKHYPLDEFNFLWIINKSVPTSTSILTRHTAAQKRRVISPVDQGQLRSIRIRRQAQTSISQLDITAQLQCSHRLVTRRALCGGVCRRAPHPLSAPLMMRGLDFLLESGRHKCRPRSFHFPTHLFYFQKALALAY